MTLLRRLAVAVSIAAAALQPSFAASRHHAAARDWSSTATAAPGGAFVLGNPKARVRLIEYASFTCSHCAAFAGEGWPAMMPSVRSGKLAIEVRLATRDRFDIVAALLARCKGPAAFFPIARDLFAQQPDWLAKAATWEQNGGGDGLDKLPPTDVALTLAHAAGFDAMLAPRGYAPPVMRACLADLTNQQAIAAMSDEAWSQRKISGTPAFMIDDVAIDVHGWAGLQPLLEDALK